MTRINQLTTILHCNKPIPSDAKQRICKRINESIRWLEDACSPFESMPSAQATDVFEEMISGQLFVELSRVERLSLIGHLIAVRSAVQFDVSTTDEIKRGLATENKRILHHLLDLPCKSGRSDEEDKSENNSEPPLNKEKGR